MEPYDKNKKLQLYKYLKEHKISSALNLASELKTSADFVLGMIESDNDYRKIGKDIITFNGLGVERCVVCAEKGMDHHNSVEIRLPPELIRGKELDNSLLSGVRGHRKCYSTVDLFFRYEGGFICEDCSSWAGKFLDGSEAEEKCNRLEDKEVGHPGVMSKQYMCNHFTPRFELMNNLEHQEDREAWEKRIKPVIEEKTNKGYASLISILEKCQLIKPMDFGFKDVL